MNTQTHFKFQTIDSIMNSMMVGAMAVTCVLLLAS